MSWRTLNLFIGLVVIAAFSTACQPSGDGSKRTTMRKRGAVATTKVGTPDVLCGTVAGANAQVAVTQQANVNNGNKVQSAQNKRGASQNQPAANPAAKAAGLMPIKLTVNRPVRLEDSQFEELRKIAVLGEQIPATAIPDGEYELALITYILRTEENGQMILMTDWKNNASYAFATKQKVVVRDAGTAPEVVPAKLVKEKDKALASHDGILLAAVGDAKSIPAINLGQVQTAGAKSLVDCLQESEKAAQAQTDKSLSSKAFRYEAQGGRLTIYQETINGQGGQQRYRGFVLTYVRKGGAAVVLPGDVQSAIVREATDPTPEETTTPTETGTQSQPAAPAAPAGPAAPAAAPTGMTAPSTQPDSTSGDTEAAESMST